MTLEERFWAKVDKSGDCWEWTGAKDRYGQIGHNQKVKAAHRVSWEIHNGAIPDGMCVLHRCDNPPCVRPDHLFIGTMADNCKDRDSKGRHTPLPGESHGMSKLTEDDVNEIREHYAYGEFTQQEIANYYSVSQAVISDVLLYKTWVHI